MSKNSCQRNNDVKTDYKTKQTRHDSNSECSRGELDRCRHFCVGGVHIRPQVALSTSKTPSWCRPWRPLHSVAYTPCGSQAHRPSFHQTASKARQQNGVFHRGEQPRHPGRVRQKQRVVSASVLYYVCSLAPGPRVKETQRSTILHHSKATGYWDTF